LDAVISNIVNLSVVQHILYYFLVLSSGMSRGLLDAGMEGQRLTPATMAMPVDRWIRGATPVAGWEIRAQTN
jgi:hypothetical protein